MNRVLAWAAGLLLVSALGAGSYAAWSYQAMTKRVAALEQTAADFKDLQARFSTLSKEVAFRRDLDQAVRANRDRLSQELEKTSREDQATAGFLAAPLPDGLREAYRRAQEQRVPIPHRD